MRGENPIRRSDPIRNSILRLVNALDVQDVRELGASNRVFGGMLVLGGLLLVSVVGYALMLGAERGTVLSDESAQVAVFYPDTNSWRTFRRGLQACEEKGILHVVGEGCDWVLARTVHEEQKIRFCWDGALGERELRQHLLDRLRANRPPVAVVGSVNTTLTLALARELDAWTRRHRAPGPVLLVTSATAVEVERSPSTSPAIEPIPEARTLLDIYPGRTFRFCLNNRRLADLAVDFLASRRGETPSAVFVVVDRLDPFSEDLAAFFDEEVRERFPDTPVLLREPGRGREPSPGIDATGLADEVWGRVREVETKADGRAVWVMLTTQGEPADRVLSTLRSRGPEEPSRSLRLLCGDGLGRSALMALARSLPCPLVSAASNSPRVPGVQALDPVAQGQIEAETVSAIVECLDPASADLAPALARLSVPAGAPSAVGRSLAFEAGERQGDDLGYVLEIQPLHGVLEAHAPGPDQDWSTLRWMGGGWRIPAPTREAASR